MNRLLSRSISGSMFAAALLVGGPALADDRFLGDVDGGTPVRHWFGGGPITVHYDSTPQQGLESGETQFLEVQAALASWENVSCTNIDFVDADIGTTNYGGFNNDGLTTITYNDPQDTLATGVLAAATSPWQDGATETVNGRLWTRITEFDIVWNDRSDFGSAAEIDNPGCSGLYDMQSVAFHEIGHGIGYAHPCDIGESCPDPAQQASIMFPTIAPCQNKRTPAAYDLETHSISYGLGTVSSFNTVTPPVGATPLTLQFAPVTFSSATILGATWNFGDGATSTALSPSHTYVAEGRYTVSLTLDGSLTACGGPFQHIIRKVDYVVACDALEPKFSFDASGKTVSFHSETDGSAAGCLQVLEWDFGDGNTSNVRDPIHTYAEGGNYTVTLTARGPGSPAGVTAEESVKTGGGGGGCGCSLENDRTPNSAAAAGALVAAVLMSIATATRRRNKA